MKTSNLNEVKACFLFHRRFAYAGHAMALTFQKKYAINQFCGYVHLRSSFEFLKSQKEINYTRLLLDEDIHKQYEKERLDLEYLKNLEREYGVPNLWPYIEIDRILRYNLLVRDYPYDIPKYTHEETMKILQTKAKAIIKFLDEEKPDFVFFSTICSLSGLLLYHTAKKKGIKTFVVRHAGIGNNYSLTENYESIESINKTFDEMRKNSAPYQNYIRQAEKFLDDFRNKPSSYSSFYASKIKQMKRRGQFSFLLPHKIFKSVSWFIKLSYGYISDKNRSDYSNVKPWHYLLDRTKRKIRVLIGFDDLYDEMDLNEDFAFFPLQYQPEASTLLYASFYADQLWLIKQIARSLPIHYKLYVKEHPMMFGYRPRRYYKELKKIPNVKLIKPGAATFDIIKNADLVTINTSTAGWEAILFKKPVITFGDAFYNELPMVKKCGAVKDLPQIVKNQLENFNYDEKSLIHFIAAIYKESVDVNLIQIWPIEGGSEMKKKEKELIPLVDLTAEKLCLKPV